MDGYQESPNLNHSDNFKYYLNNQDKLNTRLQELVKEANELPSFPGSIDDWVVSWADLNHNKNFGINTVSKHLSIQREYDRIVEQSNENIRKMKILSIDDLLDKINKILEK